MFLLTALSAAMMTGFAAADSDLAIGLGKTTGSGLRMREQPNTESGIVYKMEKGVTLAILGETENGWYHVSFNGKTGYVSSEYVDQIDAEINDYAQVNGQDVFVRAQPSDDADILNTIEDKAVVTVLGLEDDWYSVKCKYGTEGYIRSDSLNPADNGGAALEGEAITYGQVNGQDVFVRAQPNDDADILNTIDNKAYVTVLGLDDGWYAVKCKYGTKGYIRSDFLNLTSSNGESGSSGYSSPSAAGNSAVSIAMSKKGSRYVYGASGPNSFDCSGFTQWVYGRVGVSLPRTASQQWLSGPGTKVYKMSALQPGDLVFFRNPRYANGKACSHVGLYIGNNQIIHASSSRTGVIISSLSSGSYTRYFVGGRHIG